MFSTYDEDEANDVAEDWLDWLKMRHAICKRFQKILNLCILPISTIFLIKSQNLILNVTLKPCI